MGQQLHILPRAERSKPAHVSEGGTLEAGISQCMIWVLASDETWCRLPEVKLGSGHRRALRKLKEASLPGKYWIDRGRRRVDKWAETSGSAASEPTSCSICSF